MHQLFGSNRTEQERTEEDRMSTNKSVKQISVIFLLLIFCFIGQWTEFPRSGVPTVQGRKWHGLQARENTARMAVPPEPVAPTPAAKPVDLAVSEDGATLFVAMGAAKCIAYVDNLNGQTVELLSLERCPSGIAVAGGGFPTTRVRYPWYSPGRT